MGEDSAGIWGPCAGAPELTYAHIHMVGILVFKRHRGELHSEVGLFCQLSKYPSSLWDFWRADQGPRLLFVPWRCLFPSRTVFYLPFARLPSCDFLPLQRCSFAILGSNSDSYFLLFLVKTEWGPQKHRSQRWCGGSHGRSCLSLCSFSRVLWLLDCSVGRSRGAGSPCCHFTALLLCDLEVAREKGREWARTW